MPSLTEAGACREPTLQRRRMLASGLGLGAMALQGTWAQTTPALLQLTRIGRGPDVARMESALRAAYGKMGVQVDFVEMPGERAIVESNVGRVDGETARIVGMEATYPDLRRVDVPLYFDTNSIFVYGADQTVPASLDQLSQSKYVGIVRGWKTSEKVTEGRKNIVHVNSYASALQMLKFGRLDAFFGRTEDTLRELKQEGLSATDFPYKVVLRWPLFHYLHKKHEALLPALTKELLRMKGSREAVVDALARAAFP